jgi:hypothetical protein
MSLHHEVAAKVGVATTGAATATTFVATAMPYIQFFAAVIAALVGCATLVYYVLAGIEKWRNLRKK